MAGILDWLFKTQREISAPYQGRAADEKVRVVQERTPNFGQYREPGPFDTGGGRAYEGSLGEGAPYDESERRHSQDPLTDWDYRLGYDQAVHPVYKVGSERPMEEQLALALGWDGTGSMGEFLSKALAEVWGGGGASPPWMSGEAVDVASMQRLIRKATGG